MIYNDHGVYLLNAVLVEREMCKVLLKNAQNPPEAQEMIAKFEGRSSNLRFNHYVHFA